MVDRNGDNRFGQLVRQVRKHRGMSQENLALSVPMDVSYLSCIETGKRVNPSARVLYGIAASLNLSGSLLAVFMFEAAVSKGLLSPFRDMEDFDLILQANLMLSEGDEQKRALIRQGLKELVERAGDSQNQEQAQ